MSRRFLTHLLVAALALAGFIAATSSAVAQQPKGQQPATGRKPPSRERILELLERSRNKPGKPRPSAPGVAAPGVAAPAAAAPTRVKPKLYPRDEHGYCLGQGPNDRPKDINLIHGWLGVDNAKATQAPQTVASKEWWIWRLTPYPWRYENHEDHCDPRNEPVPLLANVINLAALAFLLVRFGRKPLREALAKRRSNITSEIDAARTIRKGAQTRLDRYQDDLDHLDETLTALREQYAAEGVHEEKRLQGDMEANRERMLADADFRLAQEEKVARDDLSRDALQAALEAAEALLSEKVGEQDHQRIEDAYLGQIGDALTKSQGEEGLS